MNFWFWVERLAWLSILLINLKRIIDFLAPKFLLWLLRLVMKNYSQNLEGHRNDGENSNDGFEVLAREIKKGIQTFLEPSPKNSKNFSSPDPNRRNVRARAQQREN